MAVVVLVAVVSASVNGFYWPHYALIVSPPLVALLCVAVSRLRRAPTTVMALSAVFAFIAIAAPVLPNLSLGAQSIARQGNLRPDETSERIVVANALREVLKPGDLLYTRNIHYYYLARAALPTRFFFPGQHLSDQFTRARGSTPDQEMMGIVAQHPSVVLLDRLNRQPPAQDRVLAKYLSDECHLWRTVKGARIYVCRPS
jgi:hypothetical protein